MGSDPMLTPRQEQILALVGEALTIEQIAARLGDVTPRTVKAHVLVLERKFGVARKRLLVPIALARKAA